MQPLKKGPELLKDEGLALARHGRPAKVGKSLSRYPAKGKGSRSSHNELAKVLKRLESEFNRRVRQRDDQAGRFKCVSCKVWHPSRVMEAGHFQRKGHEKLRFDPRNVHGQCHRCNCELSGSRAAYRETLVEKYGEATVVELESMKGSGGRLNLEEAHQLLREVMAGRVVA